MLDWGHIALGGWALLLTAAVLVRRASHRGIHVRIDIERDDRPESGHEKTPPDKR